MSTRLFNFGCGGNRLPAPWENFDVEVDISKPLPFQDGCAAAVFAEHVVEHVSPAEAWGFFKECRRILRPGGFIRIAVPSIERVYALADKQYLEWLRNSGFGAETKESAVENQIVNHGHKALWSVPLLKCALHALGFKDVMEMPVTWSTMPALRNAHGHGAVIGERNNQIETITVEASR